MADTRGGVPLGDPRGSMTSKINDESAAAQALRIAARDIEYAATMLREMTSDARGSSRGGGSYGGGPNGGRPQMRSNQTVRPNHGQGISGLRSVVGNAMHSRFGEDAGPKYRPYYNPEGDIGGYHMIDRGGGVTKVPNVLANGLPNPGAVSKADLAGEATRASRSGVISGLTEGGMMGMMRAIPYVGTPLMVAEGIHEAVKLVGHEREKNAQYQSIFGGSNIGTGFSNRAKQTGFRLSQEFSGGLTGKMADEAFQGVSALGFQGQQRSSDLNFISANYKSMGMGVAESMKLITTASQDANTNLVGISQALKQVSAAAKEAGTNAGTARAVFTQNYAAIGGAFPGPSSAAAAGNISTVQTGLGRLFQGTDFSQMLTSQMTPYQLSALSGGQYNAGQIMGQIASGNQTVVAGLEDKMMSQALDSMITPEMTAWVAQRAAQAPVGTMTDTQKKNAWIAQAADDMLNAGFFPAPQALIGRIVAFTHIQLGTGDGVKAVAILINHILKPSMFSAAQQKAVADKQQGLNKAKTVNPGRGMPSQSETFKLVRKPGSTVGKNVLGKGVNPVVDEALSKLKGQNVIVTTPGGQRVVSIKEAAKDYTDQIATGTALIADDPSQTVSSALGGDAETNFDYAGSGMKSGGTVSNAVTSDAASGKKGGLNSAAGQSVDTYGGGKSGGKGGKMTITVYASNQLQQLISFGGPGVTTADAGAQPIPGSGK